MILPERLRGVLEDPQVNEIFLNGVESSFVERAGHLEPIASPWAAEQDFRDFLHELLCAINKSADTRHPCAEGMLSSNLRVQITMPPVSERPHICLRRHGHISFRIRDRRCVWRLPC